MDFLIFIFYALSFLISNPIADSFAYEFLGKTYGLLTYKYPDDKQPDTKVFFTFF